jgi:large subunit ribosomal protein L18
VIDDLVGHTLVSASSVDHELRGKAERKTKTERNAWSVKRWLGPAAGIKQVVLDRGGYRYNGRVKALADGARAGGLDF